MRKQKTLLMVLILVIPGFLQADIFRFRFIKGEKYRFVATVTEKAILNNDLLNYSDFLNKIAVEVLDIRGESGVLSSVYQVSNRVYNDQTSYSLQEEYRSVFMVDPRGRHTVGPQYLFPLTRNIPTFPDSDIQPGSSWSAPGEEIHDLSRIFGIEKPYRIPVLVQYQYVADTMMNNRRMAEIKISYSFLVTITGIETNPEFWYPLKAAGQVEVLYYWDIERGKPHAFEENFDIVYYTSTGDFLEFIGNQKCEVIEAPELDHTEAASDIREDLRKEKIEGVRVEDTDKGIKLVLENIQFEADSDVIARTEKSKLDRIAAILKKYPGRDIMIIGHTAGQGTREYLQTLSQRRAKAVGDYLLALGARTSKEMTIIGKGASEPLADNFTEEGRMKNRRVEIIILEN